MADSTSFKGALFKGASINLKTFYKRLSHDLRDNVRHPMRNHAIRSFSTTKGRDTLAVAVIINSASQREARIPKISPPPKGPPGTRNMIRRCLLSVTLLGDKADWKNLLSYANDLLVRSKVGQEPRTFHDMLMPILLRMVDSFDDPDGKHTKQFLQEIAYLSGEDPGKDPVPRYLTVG